ncbi:MAG: transcription elongation factor GreA [Clostridia bacterium]|nr:transcription elongation factor GreA [Clostridia bacterium]
MEENKVLLTEEGYNKLQEELAYLKGPKKMEVAAKIKEAKEFGDLSENSEYDEAKNEQALLEAKIAELEVMVRNAEIVDNISTKEVGIGTLVKLYDYEFEEEIEYHIVGSTEIDLASGKISVESPVGKALFGHKKGEEVEVAVPDGVAKYKILEISKSM